MEKRTLKTMEEKMKLDPNEIMENGLTREQNEKMQEGAETFNGIVHLICGGIGVWCIIQALGNM